MKKVSIYTDGACSNNPGAGGWGAILIFEGIQKEISGGKEHTTNNQMELQAVIEALSILKEPCELQIFSDSQYVIRAFREKWIEKWQKNNWKNSKKEPVANREQWEQLIELTANHSVRWSHVKGHASNPFNNRCDELAVAAKPK